MVFENLSSKNILVDAFKFYNRGDARAHEFLNIIIEKRNDMPNAVKGCLDQAIQEEDPTRQKLYLQASCFGKKFYPGVAIEEYQSACRRVRVMNVLRQEKIEPNLSVEEAIRLLVSRRQFKLALWIVQYLKIAGGHIIRTEWSEHLVKQYRLTDDEVAIKIQNILGQDPLVSYADIANKAIESHRVQLAIKLLDKESHSLKQIPLLLSLKQYDRVLAHALSSCDSNLIHMAIFKLRESIPNEMTFLELLRKHPLALRYYCNYMATTDMKTLIMLSHKINSEDELLWCLLDNRMDSALSVSKKIRRDVVTQLIELSIDLNKFQQKITTALPTFSKQSSWTGLSVSDTIIYLISVGQLDKAKEAKRRFDVSDKKFKLLEHLANDTLPELTIQVNPT